MKFVNVKGVPLIKPILEVLRSDICSGKCLDTEKDRKQVARQLEKELIQWQLGE